MELTGLLPIIRRWLLVIVAATATATAVGFLLGSNVDKTYEAKAQLLVGPLSTDSNTMRASGDLAQTYAELATTSNIVDTAARDLELDSTELDGGIRATANSTTRLLSIRARSSDAETAADVANAVSLQLISLGRQDPTRPEGELRVIDAATPPGGAVSPRIDLIVPLAAIAGLLGSMTLILLFEFVGDTAESAEKVEVATGLTTLGLKRRNHRPSAPDAPRSDAMRLVATQAELAAPDVRCILITGVVRDDDSGALALELADVLGDRGRSVTVVDGGAGEITGFLEDGDGPGLGEVLAEFDPTAIERRSDQVGCLSMGAFRPVEGIQIDDARRLIDEIGADGTLVIVHAAPATLSAATLVWAQAADVTILVVRRFQARRASVVDAVLNLRTVGAHLPFAVLHEAPRPPWRRAKNPPEPSPPSPAPVSAWARTPDPIEPPTSTRTSADSRRREPVGEKAAGKRPEKKSARKNPSETKPARAGGGAR